jgi:hypothetical protein
MTPEEDYDEWVRHSDRAIDLGSGVSIEYVGWSPDRELNPQYKDVPDIERFSGLIRHTKADGSPCVGAVTFDTPEIQAVRGTGPGRAVWQVESWEPLTLSPSILCSCGKHGFIREGRWVEA